MKKRECIIAILLIFGISQIFAASCGDVNSDEVIDIVDALLIAQYYVNLDPANFNSTMADVNGDKDIDILDALLVAQYYVDLIPILDGCEQLIEPVTIEMQAEDATWDNGAVSTAHTGYTGSGFVDTNNSSGTWIEWSLDVANDTNALCATLSENLGIIPRFSVW